MADNMKEIVINNIHFNNYCIYMILNTTTNQKYIGQSKSILGRPRIKGGIL